MHFRLTRPHPTWEGPIGRYDPAVIGGIVDEFGHIGRPGTMSSPGAEYYISGPPQMVADLGDLLVKVRAFILT